MKEQNLKKGDIYPENRKIREHFFNLGNRGEYYTDETILSNENVEIKTQSLSNTKKYGNLFVEHSAKFPERAYIKPSGIRTTECDTWIFQFTDEDETYYPVSININKDYLLSVIEKGLAQGIIREQETKDLETGDINIGYLVSILYLLKPLLENTHSKPKADFCEPKKSKPTEQDRINRLKELNANKIKK